MMLKRPYAAFGGTFAAALLLAAAGACAPTDEAGMEGADATADREEPTATAEATAGPGCYLARGTPAEAAERPSPLDSASITLDGDEAKVCYGAPSVRGRVIFGELEAWDQPWRAGANEATELHLGFPAEIGGVAVEPGTYSLYAIPGQESWEIAVSEATQRWGIPVPTDQDVGRVTVTPETVEEPVETLTWRWEQISDSEAELILEWDDTRVRVPVVRTS